jgi:lantibiotic modifying enzyme
VALLGLRQLVDDPTLLDAATLLGDQLLEGAQHRNGGYSWRWDRFPFPRNLTGISHGAAGIGWALLELAIATGESRFREAAELAFSYERYWFDAASGNWPDFRMSRGGKAPASFFTRWCHGAPGIALSRVRAYELTNSITCKAEAETALASTRTSIERELASNAANYSLCHGLAGNAAILVYASRALTEANVGSSANMRLARAVADYGVAISGAGERPWRCGTHTGRETPGLMLGLAGIGYFYLCMNYPELPSVLLPHPGQWRIPLPAPITAVHTSL